jgi:hypothetical protein
MKQIGPSTITRELDREAMASTVCFPRARRPSHQ